MLSEKEVDHYLNHNLYSSRNITKNESEYDSDLSKTEY